MYMKHDATLPAEAGRLLVVLILVSSAAVAAHKPSLNTFTTVTTVSSTIPSNGDVNPYGVARIKRSVGNLVAGNILVSNFNSSANLQGTGTTIVQISPNGTQTQFAQVNAASLPGPCPGGVGLTTALSVLQAGWVIVGSLPTVDGTSTTAQAGCLLVLDSDGNVVETFSGAPINGPWDMTLYEANDLAYLFFTNVLNGTLRGGGTIVHDGTVVRLVVTAKSATMPSIVSETIIGSSFEERTDPAALVIGPTGVAFDSVGDILYVADSLTNRIQSIDQALERTTSDSTGATVSSGGFLNDPLGLALAPNGNLAVVNGDDGNIIEITPAGAQIFHQLIDNTGNPPGAGALFGLVVVKNEGVYFVDDASNTLNLLH
jgi:DNA-binding beta-propeller fold protein YncE